MADGGVYAQYKIPVSRRVSIARVNLVFFHHISQMGH